MCVSSTINFDVVVSVNVCTGQITIAKAMINNRLTIEGANCVNIGNQMTYTPRSTLHYKFTCNNPTIFTACKSDNKKQGGREKDSG